MSGHLSAPLSPLSSAHAITPMEQGLLRDPSSSKASSESQPLVPISSKDELQKQLQPKNDKYENVARAIEVTGRVISAVAGIAAMVFVLAALSNPIGWAVVGSALIIGILAGGLFPGAIRGGGDINIADTAKEMAKGVIINIVCASSLGFLIAMMNLEESKKGNQQLEIKNKPRLLPEPPEEVAVQAKEERQFAPTRTPKTSEKEARKDSGPLLDGISDPTEIVTEINYIEKGRRPEVVHYATLLTKDLPLGYQRAWMVGDVNGIINNKENYPQIFEHVAKLFEGRSIGERRQILEAIAKIPPERLNEVVQNVDLLIKNIPGKEPQGIGETPYIKQILGIIHTAIIDPYVAPLAAGLDDSEKSKIVRAVENFMRERTDYENFFRLVAPLIADRPIGQRLQIMNAIHNISPANLEIVTREVALLIQNISNQNDPAANKQLEQALGTIPTINELAPQRPNYKEVVRLAAPFIEGKSIFQQKEIQKAIANVHPPERLEKVMWGVGLLTKNLPKEDESGFNTKRIVNTIDLVNQFMTDHPENYDTIIELAAPWIQKRSVPEMTNILKAIANIPPGLNREKITTEIELQIKNLPISNTLDEAVIGSIVQDAIAAERNEAGGPAAAAAP